MTGFSGGEQDAPPAMGNGRRGREEWHDGFHNQGMRQTPDGALSMAAACAPDGVSCPHPQSGLPLRLDETACRIENQSGALLRISMEVDEHEHDR
ncbi:hypothetical protein [Rhizobium sp. CF080]|uniref:hypothetical protein n=1 Tax=Rhizobium sp. (strain CF080) TaxID=1144310 RepID=UPI0012DD5C1F|nr:hypothetical protein [Rhizobium sp. CF080]